MPATLDRPILCGTDFSRGADAAVEHAIELGRALHRPVVIAHVMDTGAGADAATPQGVAEAERVMHARVHDRVEKARATLAARIANSGGAIEPIVLDGRPCEALVTHAAKINAAWIVVGAHGASRAHAVRDATRGWLFGSTAERVIRHAERPVIVIPPTGD